MRNKNVSHLFYRQLAQTARQGQRLLDKLPDHSESAIHDTRILIKRLRALLWLIKPSLSLKMAAQSSRRLRKAAQMLATSRDEQVFHATLKLLVGDEAPSPPARSEEDKKIMVAHRSKALRLILKTVQQLGEPSAIEACWPTYEKRTDKAFRKIRKAGKKTSRSEKDEAFHEWRKKTKCLIYLLDLAPTKVRSQSAPLIKKLGKLQHLLGLHHDCVMTQERLSRTPRSHSAPPRVEKLIEKRKKRLGQEAFKIAAHLVATSPAS